MRFSGPCRLAVVVLAVAALSAACGRGESAIEPGPGRPDEPSSTTPEATTDRDDEVSTVEDAPTTSTEVPSTGTAIGQTTVVIDQSSANAQEYTELAASGLVLSLDEQGCADAEVEQRLDDGAEQIDAVIDAVKICASPKAVDDFASVLISAGGTPLPPTEAACVASSLRDGDDFRPFWAALFAEEPFDFLAAELDVQNQYLDLYSDCVSIGRALADQTGAGLSPSTVGCIDSLYSDREFVRITIEADLAADQDEIDRVNSQIATCLLPEERAALGFS